MSVYEVKSPVTHPSLCEDNIRALEVLEDGDELSAPQLAALISEIETRVLPVAMARIHTLAPQLEKARLDLQIDRPAMPPRIARWSSEASSHSSELTLAAWHLALALVAFPRSHPAWVARGNGASAFQELMEGTQVGFSWERAVCRLHLLAPRLRENQADLICLDVSAAERGSMRQRCLRSEQGPLGCIAEILADERSTAPAQPPAPRPIRPIHFAFLAVLIYFSVRMYCSI